MAVALDNIADHEGDNLQHCYETNSGPSWDISIYDGYNALVF
jgi:hypothetical protein